MGHGVHQDCSLAQWPGRQRCAGVRGLPARGRRAQHSTQTGHTGSYGHLRSYTKGSPLMDRHSIETLLNEVREGRTPVSEALDRLRDLPFEDLGFAKLDHHRALRTGMPEVIFGAGKTAAQVATIFSRMAHAGGNVLATRVSRDMFDAVQAVEPRA